MFRASTSGVDSAPYVAQIMGEVGGDEGAAGEEDGEGADEEEAMRQA